MYFSEQHIGMFGQPFRYVMCRKPAYVVFLALLFLVSCTAYRSAYISDRGVYYYNRIEIGGINQAIMVRGHDKNNPVMLFLHGGPGFPLFPVDQASSVMRQLEEHFTMVYWEQRGTGGSFSWRLPLKSLTVEDFVEDTREVIEYVNRLLGSEKVFIWGHSWGSTVGALFAAQYPEYLHAYVSTGQSVNPFLNERLSYTFVMDRAFTEGNRRALRDMERVDTIPERYTLRDALLVRRWVYRFGGVVKQQDERGKYIDFAYILNTLSAPEYGVLDKVNMVLMPYFSAEELWEDLKKLNLMEKAPKIDVPVFFLLGRYDFVVSSVLAEEYFYHLEVPMGKWIIWFDESAHRPHHEEKEKFLEVMEQMVLPLARP
ncbi:MAG: alpha/beta hydrolase [Bacteroidia bacterium]|nr:MAG: alpha/beta hydrolase [Bacteroidia bacterium]